MSVKKIKFMNDIELKSKKFPTPEVKMKMDLKCLCSRYLLDHQEEERHMHV